MPRPCPQWRLTPGGNGPLCTDGQTRSQNGLEGLDGLRGGKKTGFAWTWRANGVWLGGWQRCHGRTYFEESM